MQNSKAAAVILTFNEEHNIANAVTNVSQYFEDVFVLDLLSTDNTVAKAKEAGAIVLGNKFEDYAS